LKHWYPRIAHAVMHVQTNIPACIPMLDAMLKLYPMADAQASIAAHLYLKHDGDKNIFFANDCIIWEGYDAEETAAGFEVHFYKYMLANIEPEVISIHAACVSINTSSVMLAGISGAGKSSSCTAALLAGASYLSDEFALLDKEGHMHPFPRPLQWGKQRHPAFLHRQLLQAGFEKFGFRFNDFKQKRQYNLFWFPPHITKHAIPLKAIIFPQYSASAEDVEITPVLRSQALMELNNHLHHRYPPAKCIQELNQRVPQGIPFLYVEFSDVQQAWKAISQYLQLP